MQDVAAPAQAEEAPERIGWLELFFDLVVVVSLAFLAERLHEHTGWGGLGVFLVVFGALWLTWISFVIYTNIASEATHVPVLIIAAGVIALMATTLPHLDERANTFAIGFVICRVMAARASMHTGRMLTSWPAVQLGGVSAIWIGSLWVDPPAKYWVWGAAVAVELTVSIHQASGDPQAAAAVVDRINERIRRRVERHAERRDDGRTIPQMVPVAIRSAHIGDRLGAFAIIVLGEGVTEVITASTESDPSGHHLFPIACGFLILAGMWWLIFNHGLGRSDTGRGLRATLPVHLVSAASLTLLAASLGELLLDVDEPTREFWRWLACGALAAWFAVAGTVAAAQGDSRRWILTRPLVSGLAAVAIALLAGDLEARWVIPLILLAVAWTASAPRPPRRDAAAPA